MKVTNVYELIHGEGFEANMAQVKSVMLILLTCTLRQRYATRREMAEAIGATQSRLCHIMNGKIEAMSFTALADYLDKLGLKLSGKLEVSGDTATSVSIVIK